MLGKYCSALCITLAMLQAPVAHATTPIVAHLESFTALHPGSAPSYLLLVSEEAGTASSPNLGNIANRDITDALKAKGYEQEVELLDADLVVVARVGLLPQWPSVDEILTNNADPDVPLAEGKLYIRIEAYEVKALTEFLSHAGNDLADGGAAGFILWETAAEAFVDTNLAAEIMPALSKLAANHLDSNTPEVAERI